MMVRSATADELEAAIRELTTPINGQYPRPWMTSLKDPTEANVFTVGKNQRKGFDVSSVGSHDHFIDTLFNRGSETCRSLYDRIAGSPSPTRVNTDNLVHLLTERSVSKIIETNVICYSTPMSADLRSAHHLGGAARGTEIFRFLLSAIRPRILISHGADTARKLGKLLGRELPQPPSSPAAPMPTWVGSTAVIVIPSLAPPAFNMWSGWAQNHLSAVGDLVAEIVHKG
jgi:hypothetical protein